MRAILHLAQSLLPAALLTSFAGAVHAAGGPFELDYCFASQLQSMKHSETHSINLANGTAVHVGVRSYRRASERQWVLRLAECGRRSPARQL